jgi:carbamoyltransferase
MTSRLLHDVLDGPPRAVGRPITQRDMDVAASAQAIVEEAMLRSARHVHEQTGEKNLCLAGGVSLNCVANGRVVREGPFENVWIQPAAEDSGGALGAALFVWHQLLGNERRPSKGFMQSALLGPEFSSTEMSDAAQARGLPVCWRQVLPPIRHPSERLH